MMHTYQPGDTAHTHWVVGYYILGTENRAEAGACFPTWITVKDFVTEVEAAAYVSYLNGGARPQ